MQKIPPSGQPEEAVSADVSWHDAQMPFCERYQDFYYSREDGRAETQEVFLGGNGLPERWGGEACFTIAELGFGTGLNFLQTWHAWRRSRTPQGQLSFVSFEAHPMSSEDMDRALAAWPALSGLAAKLLSAWPRVREGGAVAGIDPQTNLHVIMGEAARTVGAWSGRADAWYLDGFAPAQNPDMWSPDLMRAVFAHTSPGGTFSTYTAAGWVRRNLEEAGFCVERVPGFGRKRHRLQGRRP
ncbi:MAG: tRNA (5-methylaminomethyl-2-thiouridine)(34)-methyltransferase MnmD [Pseudomonadota bacterium]